MPTVSVIIPAFNALETIDESLRSLRGQSFADFETIVVDDGSTDGTADHVAAAFPEVILCRQRNGGPAAARNAGAEVATGEWLAFLDADDLWLPWRLELQLAGAAKHPDVDLWAGDIQLIGLDDEELSAPGELPPINWVELSDLAVSNRLATTTVLLRRDLFQELGGFDTRFRGPEDYELWLRVAARGRIALIEYPLVRYRVTPDSLSRNDQRFLPEVEAVLRKAYGPGGVLAGDSRYAEALACQYVSCSWMAYQSGARRRAVWLMLRSLARYPRPLNVRKIGRAGRLKLLLRYLLLAPSLH